MGNFLEVLGPFGFYLLTLNDLSNRDGWMDDALILPLKYVMLNGHISMVK